jgi:hypothetical protein
MTVYTRRELLERAAAGGALLTVPGFLAACGGTSKKSAAGTSSHKLAKTLHFSNWPYYIDTNNKTHSHPSLQQFQKKFGVHVQYTEDINDNASFFGKIQGQLSRGQSIGRDIIVLTDNDRYLALTIKKGWAEKLDKSAIPNMKNLIGVQQHPGFDPNRDYSLPWQSGMTGIAYNDKISDPVLTVEDHALQNGFGTAVLEYAQAHALPTKWITRLGHPERLIAHATRPQQLAEVGLDPAGLVRSIRDAIGAAKKTAAAFDVVAK